MKIVEGNLKFKNLDYGNKPVMLVYHHPEASKCTIQDIHNWHLNFGWSGCGYHFLVRKDGSIYRGRPENAIGAHCPGVNDKSIGICAEGSYDTETMPASQKNALIELGIYLKSKYGIKQVYGHKDLYATACPGNNYPLAEIKNSVLKGITINNKTYKVQLGAFKKKSNAESLLKELQSKGYQAYIKEE